MLLKQIASRNLIKLLYTPRAAMNMYQYQRGRDSYTGDVMFNATDARRLARAFYETRYRIERVSTEALRSLVRSVLLSPFRVNRKKIILVLWL